MTFLVFTGISIFLLRVFLGVSIAKLLPVEDRLETGGSFSASLRMRLYLGLFLISIRGLDQHLHHWAKTKIRQKTIGAHTT